MRSPFEPGGPFAHAESGFRTRYSLLQLLRAYPANCSDRQPGRIRAPLAARAVLIRPPFGRRIAAVRISGR